MIQGVIASLGLGNGWQITQLCNEEDGAPYQVWRLDRAGERYVLKRANDMELENYQHYFHFECPAVPKFFGVTQVDGESYILLEAVEGHHVMRAEQGDLRRVLDALIRLQKQFWQGKDPLDRFVSSLEGRKNRRNYLLDKDLERVYDAYLEAYVSMPGSLCHDDLLPFNVLVNDDRAVLIDWEYAGILPYATSLARLIAHCEEDENAFFFMKNVDKAFAIDYYFEHLAFPMGISREVFDRHLQLCLFYEYCEWVYVGNRYGNTDSQRFRDYLLKAKAFAAAF